MYGLYQIVYFTIMDILRTFKSPFFILLVFILYYLYRDNSKMPFIATINSLIFGALGGLIATVIFLYLQVYLIPMDFIYILIVTIILSLIDTRFICFAYGGSIVVLSNLLFAYPNVDSYDLMLLISVLHMVEALLIVLNGDHQSEVTIFTLGYKDVGGYKFNRIWPLPLVLFIGDTMIKPITIIALLSYGDFTISNYPKNKTVKSGIVLFLYGLLLLIITKYSTNQYISPIIAISGHEFIIHINKYREKNKLPLFTNPHEGIRVLAVKDRSIAKKIGISKGDIILEINDAPINDEGDLEDIEIINQGIYKIRFFSIKKGIMNKTYRGKIKTLGIIPMPRVL
ncbi:MAG TPA: PDZ domain-containing protein [Tissierellaceae bacterium]|nr:PDZ domain-containing protein [Tissierellaceae bacterium]